MEGANELAARLRRRAAGAVLAMALGASGMALGQQAPDKLVKTVADEVASALHQDEELRAGSQTKFAELLEQKVAPHFDFERMTRLAVGRGWRQATPEQQKTLVELFHRLLIRTYSAAYSAYADITIEVKPLRMKATDDDVQVHSEIKVPNGAQPLSVDYSMYKASADWKIYDVTVEGVSLVTTYRSTFAEEIRQSGIDGLIKSLQEKTSAPPAGTRKQQ
ncbi:MAG TPA: ABC transporter substrate-binding protein [Burkholderiales bacterium]|nr:ABC transporter substrate-binding protein [Burkholderiales bacterium]